MGGDCCGNASETQAAQEQLQSLNVKEASPAAAAKRQNGPAPKAAEVCPSADPEQLKKKQAYYEKRIALFEQYRERQTQAKEDAKAANVPLKGMLWFWSTSVTVLHAE